MEITIDYNNIKKIRESRHMSIRELAELAGIGSTTLHYIETNQRQPSHYIVCLIAIALDVKITDLYNLHLRS